MHNYICIYIYIYIERERERYTHTHICIYTHTHSLTIPFKGSKLAGAGPIFQIKPSQTERASGLHTLTAS